MDESCVEEAVGRRVPKSPLAREIGALVRSHRQRSSMSMRHLADAADVSEHEVRRVELGYHEPTIRTVRRLATALGTDVSDLIPRS